ncbi:hypothetical protein L083_3741 [Actinoplanes sp. N902-109]|nr:hypothetical protein L083_3741 [Actinoplanes sp. N902-109]
MRPIRRDAERPGFSRAGSASCSAGLPPELIERSTAHSRPAVGTVVVPASLVDVEADVLTP